jgi:hypothetical protein
MNDTAEAAMTQPIEPFRRVRYFAGRLITAEDLAAEQEYHSGKRRLQNRLLFGMGVAVGLECRWSERGGLILEPGVAIDCVGREIVVPEQQQIAVPSLEGRFCLAIAATERGIEPIPVPGSEDVVHSMIEEGFELLFVDSPPDDGHTARDDGRLVCCGEDHPVPLARLRWKEKGLRVHAYRRRPESRASRSES